MSKNFNNGSRENAPPPPPGPVQTAYEKISPTAFCKVLEKISILQRTRNPLLCFTKVFQKQGVDPRLMTCFQHFNRWKEWVFFVQPSTSDYSFELGILPSL